jgi:SPP1 family phage portal protein
MNKEKELTIELLQKMINKFNIEIKPKLKKNKDYYDGKQAILNKAYSDSTKPCSKVVINYCKNIADSYAGYLASPEHISYSSDQDIESIMDILRYNDHHTEDSDFLLDALVYSVAYELMYIDEASQVRFKLLNPLQCFAIYDDSLTGDLIGFVRMYDADLWDDSNLMKVDVYLNDSIKQYTMSGDNGYLTFNNEERHYFSQVPVNVLSMPNEESIFHCIKTMQDAVNEIVSSEIDDFSAFCDAYLTLTGLDATPEDIASMKENRVLVLPEGGNAEWLIKQTNNQQTENILKRIHDSIYRVASCPDFSSESFVGGVSSGIAIQYRLTGMETRAAKICANMKKALLRRIEIIGGVASLKTGEDIIKDIDIVFKRNIPVDSNSTISMINSLQGIVSDKTLLSQLDFVNDVNKELEQVKEQKQANIEAYALNAFTSPEEDEDNE